MVQFCLREGAIAVQTCRRPEICPGAKVWSKPPGAVSRYKFTRSQKFVTVQKFAGGQMRVSGCPGHDKLSRKQESPQKP